MFHVPENNRVQGNTRLSSSPKDGNNGFFIIPLGRGLNAQVIASDGFGWEHVSVTIRGKKFAPTWGEMSKIKALFWDETDTVIQYHPAKDDYINNHAYCLHLWRPINQPLPKPPTEMVGLK